MLFSTHYHELTDLENNLKHLKNVHVTAYEEDGKITFSGIAAGTYTLTETDTLNGYNLLDAPIIVTITPDVDDPSQATVAVSSGEGTASGNVITIVNQSGTTLPSTGGMGTTIFYTIGAVLVLGAGVLMVTRRRMAN